ncbi:MAG: inositol monophosphatase family protein [Candidatus Omnitrophota bacterium]
MSYLWPPSQKALIAIKKKIKVSNICNLNESLLATGFSYKIRKAKDDNVGHFKDFLRVSQAVRRAGSASLDLCYVACGRFDGFWELDLNPWDTAAGWLIIKEAGGKVTAFNSSKYNPFLKEILASNGKIHREMSRILTKQNSKNPRLNTV